MTDWVTSHYYYKISVALLEEALGHLVKATTPGEELVGGVLRDKTLGVEAGSLLTSGIANLFLIS